MNIKKSDMDKILNREFKELKKSLKNAKHEYHSFCFSTVNSKKPSIRTVILRDFNENFLSFNSDVRSSKIQDIYNHSEVSALFYDKGRRVQLRMTGNAKINHQNDTAKKVWDKVDLQSRKCYMGAFPPGKRLDNWIPNIPLEYLETDPTKQDSELGYDNFCSISMTINSIDVLELHYDGHVRFMVKYKENKKLKYFVAT